MMAFIEQEAKEKVEEIDAKVKEKVYFYLCKAQSFLIQQNRTLLSAEKYLHFTGIRFG